LKKEAECDIVKELFLKNRDREIMMKKWIALLPALLSGLFADVKVPEDVFRPRLLTAVPSEMKKNLPPESRQKGLFS